MIKNCQFIRFILVYLYRNNLWYCQTLFNWISIIVKFICWIQKWMEKNWNVYDTSEKVFQSWKSPCTGGKKILFTNMLLLTCKFRYFKEGTSEKGCVEIEDWGFSVPFVLGFEETPFTPYAYVFAKVLQNGAKFIQKLTPCFKNYMKDLKNFRKAAESLNLMCFVQKLHSFT